MITTSADFSIAAPAVFFSAPALVCSLSTEPPACFTQSATASMIALEVRVTPETTSTASVWFLTMAAGTRAMAGSEIPGVSPCLITSTLLIAVAVKVVFTVTVPFLPAAEPVYAPALNRAASPAGWLAQATSARAANAQVSAIAAVLKNRFMRYSLKGKIVLGGG